MRPVVVLSLALLSSCGDTPGEVPSEGSRGIAAYARSAYSDSAVATLAELVSFRTVHEEGVNNDDNPQFRELTAYLAGAAAASGLDFTDHGAVVVIGLGDGEERLGLITHADVQPADADKWEMKPFILDTLSEPGRLMGRGVEDDKGPIVAALYAMRALTDQAVPVERRIELIISYTEESDWSAFEAFLKRNEPPELNVGLDSQFPVVLAEKGWNGVYLRIPAVPEAPPRGARLVSLRGGSFLSQVPEDAEAVISDATPAVEATLRAAAERFDEIDFVFTEAPGVLAVSAHGLSAHSSKPWEGRNAITNLAAVLGSYDWPDTQAARMVHLINDLVGTGDYAERLGGVADTHPFMGRLTLSLTKLSLEDGDLVAGINIRSPASRSPEELRVF